MWGRRGTRGPYSARRQKRSADSINMSPAIMMLLIGIYQKYEELPIKPPVTFGVIGTLLAAHIYPNFIGAPIDAICLSSPAILEAVSLGYWEDAGRRVLLSQLIHADDIHLYYNVTSLLVKGVLLEQRMGSEEFAFFLAFAIVTSAALYTIAGAVFNTGNCAIGFSTVLFAMKLILDHDNPDAQRSIWGIRVAARHAAWLEMLVASYVNPRSSMLGHAAGIVAGLIWLHLPKDTIRKTLYATFSQQSQQYSKSHTNPPTDSYNWSTHSSTSRRPRYSYASGTTASGAGTTKRRRPPGPAPEGFYYRTHSRG